MYYTPLLCITATLKAAVGNNNCCSHEKGGRTVGKQVTLHKRRKALHVPASNMRVWCQSPKRSTTAHISHRELEPGTRDARRPAPTAVEHKRNPQANTTYTAWLSLSLREGSTTTNTSTNARRRLSWIHLGPKAPSGILIVSKTLTLVALWLSFFLLIQDMASKVYIKTFTAKGRYKRTNQKQRSSSRKTTRT